MGSAYRKVDGGGWLGLLGFLKSYWETGKSCEWVEACKGATGEGKDVLFFRGRSVEEWESEDRVRKW